MAYNIKLFVHGVPNGQDIWGNPGVDAKYIEAFYGRKSAVTSQMLLEVMQFGGENNAYYTYYYCNPKLQEKEGRTGGYFALTLRINYYYADIQNIYNLLEAAFNKYIVGTILEYTNGGGCRFKISQFKQVNDNLNALEKELEHYLMQFSNDKDFMPLVGFKSNGQNEIGTINLLEAVSSVVANHVKATGRISISSLYPSSKEQQIINKMNAEVQTARTNAQQQIAAIQQKTQQDITNIRTQAEREIRAAQTDKLQSIQAVKNEYKEADKTINQLRSNYEKANKEISKLCNQVNDLSLQLQNSKTYKAKYEEIQKKLDKSESLIAEIKKNLSGLSGISGLLGISGTENVNVEPEPEETKGLMSMIHKFHPLIDLFLLLILIIIVGLTLPKSCTNKECTTHEQKDKTEVVTSEKQNPDKAMGNNRTPDKKEEATTSNNPWSQIITNTNQHANKN